jgi:hypothetical protein
MKAKLFVLLTIFSFNSFATPAAPVELSEDIEIITDDENFAPSKIKISDVKELLGSMNPDATCMDEYLKRRRQLIVKLSLSPITIVGGTAAATFGGAFSGSMLALLLVSPSGGAYVEPLKYLLLGGFYGFAAGSAGTITDTNMAAFQLADIDTLLKTLAEQYRNESGKKSQKAYERFAKKQEDPLSKEEFLSKLMEMDASGKLCDGSMVKQSRIKIGSKLKYQVARTKHLRKAALAASLP